MNAAFASPAAVGLKCEGRTEPLGIDVSSPRLSWILESADRGERQTVYQILVASSPDKLAAGTGDLWDSGNVTSSESLGIPYGGRPLKAGDRAYWQVRAWGRDQKPGAYSAASWWEQGLTTADWKAAWISRPRATPLSEAAMFDDDPAPLLRKEFSAHKEIRRARAYVSGLGYYELRLNGERVGDHVLDPGWTSYAKHVLYSTYDVTAQVKQGKNAVGIMLGNGWFNPLPLKLWGHRNLRDFLTIGEPRAIVQLVVEFTDGTSQTVLSDETWKAGDGAVIRNDVYLGEKYDARHELKDWDRAGFDDSKWPAAVRATEPVGPLRAQDAPPIRITRTLKAVKLTQPKPGVWIFDFGQNFAGWSRLHVHGDAGTHVKMRYGELLNPDGTLNGMTSVCGQIKRGGPNYIYPGNGAPKTAWQMDEYILSGSGDETYTPRFTFHGFRYVEVVGFPGEPTLQSLEGLRLNSDVESVGSFSCSNEMFNRIQEMVLWTELSNLFSVQSDCPHREKFGYGGDIAAASEMAMCNFDMARFYAKSVDDLQDAVRPNDGFTETAPFVGIGDEGLGEHSGPIEWSTAHPLLQCQLYQYYGDRRLMTEQYESTKRWVDLLKSKAKDDILDNGLSDHEGLVPKPRALTGTAFYYFNVKLFAQIASTLGKTEDASAASQLAERIKIAFNRKFLTPGTGKYDAGTQICQAIALYMDLVPQDERERALKVLTDDITEAHGGHLTTGIFGTKYMLNVLTAAGRSDVAYTIANQRTFPGWGFMLENGATTLWEHWQFSDNTFSHNHPMFGSVGEWFYKSLAGINAAPDAVGFDKIIIKPHAVGDLKWVKASYQSVRGKVISEWIREGKTFSLRVRVPVGAKATIVLPAKAAELITESGKPLGQATGVRFVRIEGDSAVLEAESGEYTFACQ